MIAGALVGSAVAVGMLGGLHLTLPWIVTVGLAKLTLLASGGLTAAGAVCHRLALRREQRALPTVSTAQSPPSTSELPPS